jgi:peptidyl-prolyl cis-trans isomerase SurA
MLYIKKIITAFVFILGVSIYGYAQPMKAIADKIVAIVGDKVILHSDVKNSILDMQRQGDKLPEDAECLLMERAIISKMLMLQAQKDSLPVTDEEVEANLDNRIRRFIQQFGTQQALEEVAGKTIYQIKDDARESVKEQMLAEAMQKKIVENVRITPTEVKAFFEKIPKDSLPFYESELEIGQIVIYPKASRDLEEYIISEMNNYKRQVENKITSFAALATKVTEDPGSKDRGGLYELNRNEKTWDPVFLSTAFRLKEGEISAPVKTKFGYHIILLEQRNGDIAIVRHILRVPPITDIEIKQASVKLDTIRSKIVAGTIGFNEAGSKHSEDESAKFLGPFIVGQDGSTYVTIDQLDKDMVATISQMKVGDISQPVVFTDPQSNKKGVRIIFLKSRSEPHRMNMRDDYSKISQFALEQKKSETVDKWMKAKIPTYYVMVDNTTATECPLIQKYNTTDAKGF